MAMNGIVFKLKTLEHIFTLLLRYYTHLHLSSQEKVEIFQDIRNYQINIQLQCLGFKFICKFKG